jgi:hypothetical protein
MNSCLIPRSLSHSLASQQKSKHEARDHGFHDAISLYVSKWMNLVSLKRRTTVKLMKNAGRLLFWVSALKGARIVAIIDDAVFKGVSRPAKGLTRASKRGKEGVAFIVDVASFGGLENVTFDEALHFRVSVLIHFAFIHARRIQDGSRVVATTGVIHILCGDSFLLVVVSLEITAGLVILFGLGHFGIEDPIIGVHGGFGGIGNRKAPGVGSTRHDHQQRRNEYLVMGRHLDRDIILLERSIDLCDTEFMKESYEPSERNFSECKGAIKRFPLLFVVLEPFLSNFGQNKS